jgi:hypothetical protein
MIARRHADVAELNLMARRLLREASELGTEEIALPGGRFAVGDRVVVKRNAHDLDVSNGERGRVVAIGEHGVTLERGPRRVDLDSSFLLEPTEHGEPSLVHGYAITGHVAQGLTTERTFVLAESGGTREWLYVAMSRGRQANRLYIADENRARDEFAPTDPHRPDAWRRLAAALGRSEAQPMAIDLAAEAARDRRRDLDKRIAARQRGRVRDDDFDDTAPHSTGGRRPSRRQQGLGLGPGSRRHDPECPSRALPPVPSRGDRSMDRRARGVEHGVAGYGSARGPAQARQ